MKNLVFIFASFFIMACENTNTSSLSIQENNDGKIVPSNALPLREIKQSCDNTSLSLYPNGSQHEIDINSDGMKDKIIITHHQDDGQAIIFINQGDKCYAKELAMPSMIDEAFRHFYAIMPRSNHQGFILETYFPDRGDTRTQFYIRKTADDWMIEHIADAGGNHKGDYLCVFNINKAVLQLDELPYSYYDSAETGYNCPVARRYRIVKNKAVIYDESFEPTKAYYIKDDIVSVYYYQNLDWIKIVYKNGTKIGYLSKKDLRVLMD